MRRGFILSAIAPLVCASAIEVIPAATDAVAMKEIGLERGWTPKPTTAPQPHRDLIKRQAATQIMGYLAQNEICGYVGGRSGAVKSCDAGEYCGAVLGTDAFYTMGCCGSGMCTLYGQCYESASMSACDQACRQDANVVKCDASSAPYCYGYSVPGMSMGFYSCDSISASTFEAFETTYSGESNPTPWLSLRQSDFDSLLASTPVDLTSSRPSADGLGSRVSSSAGAASSSAAPTPTPVEEKKSTPIGAIVGGVVGGVVVLGAAIGAVIFFLLKKKRNERAAAAAQTSAPQMGYNAPNNNNGYQPPNGAGNTTSGYFAPGKGGDPKYEQGGVSVTETPMSPAPAYQPAELVGNNTAPPNSGYQMAELGETGVAAPPPQSAIPSPPVSPSPPSDPRFSGYQAYAPPQAELPQQQPASPVELASTSSVPTHHNGRPVYEAA